MVNRIEKFNESKSVVLKMHGPNYDYSVTFDGPFAYKWACEYKRLIDGSEERWHRKFTNGQRLAWFTIGAMVGAMAGAAWIRLLT